MYGMLGFGLAPPATLHTGPAEQVTACSHASPQHTSLVTCTNWLTACGGQAAGLEMLEQGVARDDKFCWTCRVVRPARSKHCGAVPHAHMPPGTQSQGTSPYKTTRVVC